MTLIEQTVCQHEQQIRMLKDMIENKEVIFVVVLLNLSWGKRWEQFSFLPSGGSTLLTKAEKQQQKAKQKIKTQTSSGERNKKTQQIFPLLLTQTLVSQHRTLQSSWNRDLSLSLHALNH